jgi:hypothetical protein
MNQFAAGSLDDHNHPIEIRRVTFANKLSGTAAVLTKSGIKAEYYVSPDLAQAMTCWKGSLNFFVLLFKD